MISSVRFKLWAYILFMLIFHCHIANCGRNFALNKPAYQSSTMNFNNFNWTADMAVDGNTDGSNPDIYRTCSGTAKRMGIHTWEVDIGFLIIVKIITVYERFAGNDQLSGFQVFIGNYSSSWRANKPLVKESSADEKRHLFRVNNSLARFISVIRKTGDTMTICEVEVDGECLDGVYSEFCNHTCEKCFDGQLCNKDTGECLRGCEPGWRGILCAKECDNGTYGSGCTETCGKCFNGTNSCSKTDGQCMNGCEAGWSGGTCKIGSSEKRRETCPDVDAGAIGGSVGGICVIAIIINIITVAVLKKRMKKYTSDIKMQMKETGLHNVDSRQINLAVHNTEPATGDANRLEGIQIADAEYEELQDYGRTQSSTYCNLIDTETDGPK